MYIYIKHINIDKLSTFPPARSESAHPKGQVGAALGGAEDGRGFQAEDLLVDLRQKRSHRVVRQPGAFLPVGKAWEVGDHFLRIWNGI